MKKLLLSILLFAGAVMAYGQTDTVPNLLITEWFGDNWHEAYVEVTNMGDTAIDMSNVFYASIAPGHGLVPAPYGFTLGFTSDHDHSTYLTGILDPGESMVITSMYDALDGDGATKNLKGFLETNHFFSYRLEASDYFFPYHPEIEMWGKDSVSTVAAGGDNNFEKLLRMWGGYASAIWFKYPDGDSVMVDQCRFGLNDANTNVEGNGPVNDVAGIVDATRSHILVRKAGTPKGNLDWDASRGVDITDSEWLPIPRRTGKTLFTTVGNHGDYGIDLTPKSTVDIVDTTAMTVEWGVYKGDSIMDEFTIGMGMGWQYLEDTIDFADSVHSIVQTGDILNVFAVGNDLEWHSYMITVAPPATDMALVFPKRRMRYEAIVEDDFNDVMWGGEPYYVTEDQPGMDSIGDVPFATRVDTLFKYLEKAPAATWVIDWVDGNERVDVQHGDILMVTAEDGTTAKEYFISVDEFEASDNARLGAITWPEKPEWIFDWNGDTIPGFNPTNQSYVLKLDYGTMLVPALLASPEELNATISVDRATSLSGGAEQRTTTFSITAEDDSTVLKYSVLFVIDRPPDLAQPYVGEPFISEMVAREQAWGNMLEIMNPQGVTLDLSEYMFVVSNGLDNPAEAVADIRPDTYTADNWENRFSNVYVPGYKFAGDTSEWKLKGMRLISDPAVDPVVEPMDVFVIAQAHDKVAKVSLYLHEVDVVISPTVNSPWPNEPHFIRSLLNNLHFDGDNYTYMFKIISDSVFDGDKEVGDIADLELIDRFGPTLEGYNIAGRVLDNSKATRLMLKPHVFMPTLELGAGFGTTAENSDWIMNHSFDEGWEQTRMSENIGTHAMDFPTIHISTVASLVYLVDDGYVGDLEIQGDFMGLTVNGLVDNILKADTGQVLTVMNVGVKGPDDAIAGGDTLMVVSSNGNNTTYYTLVDQPLDDNALIVVKPAYTGSYTVAVDGAAGTISGSGIQWGMPLKDILSALDMPDLATFNIIDQNDRQVPLKIINYDMQTVDVRLSDSIFFEVVAQNGTNIIYYQLKPESMSDEAFVVSSMFLVDQDNVNISLIPEGIGVEVLMEWIDAVTGATATVIDKFGFARTSGTLYFDDKLEVVSEDGTNRVVYYLNFLNEDMLDNNLAPTLSVDITSANIELGESLTLKATADDDGMPLPTALTVTWEVVSGEGVTIVTPDALETDITFDQAGAVVLKVTVDDGEISKTEIVNVGVSTPGNNAPTVSATTASFTTDEGVAINLSATADDDGNPIGSTLTYSWSVKTGEEGNVAIATPDQLDSEVTISVAGVYTLQITVTDGELVATDIVVVVVEETVGIVPVLEPAINLYPNPASSMLTLEMQNMNEVISTVKLFNITGQAVFNGEFAESKLQIDVSNFDAGLYFVTVRSGDQTFTERIQIVK